MSILQSKLLKKATLFMAFTILFVPTEVLATGFCDEGDHQTLLDSIEHYINKNLKIPDSANLNVSVRLLRGTEAKHFETLADDVSRRMVLVTDGSVLKNVSGKSKSEIVDRIADLIGYEKEYLQYLRSKNTKFKLLVFIENGRRVSGDWIGLEQYLYVNYGQKAVRLMRKYRRDFESNSFEDLSSMGKMSFKDAYRLGEKDSRYLTYERLSADASLWEFRSFLYNELRLTELYKGDGFTRTESGEIGAPEYFYINEPVRTVGDHVLIDL